MMSSLVNAVLFLALVLTSVIVVAMYRKLKQLDAYHAEYKLVFDRTAEALGLAGDAVKSFSAEGRELLEALGVRIEEARSVIVDLETATRIAKQSQTPGPSAPARAEPDAATGSR